MKWPLQLVGYKKWFYLFAYCLLLISKFTSYVSPWACNPLKCNLFLGRMPLLCGLSELMTSIIAILKYRWVSPSLLASGRLGPTATCGLPSCTSWTGATASTSPQGGVPTKPFVLEWPSHRRIQGPPPFIRVADFDWPCHLKVCMHCPSEHLEVSIEHLQQCLICLTDV